MTGNTNIKAHVEETKHNVWLEDKRIEYVVLHMIAIDENGNVKVDTQAKEIHVSPI